jgi:ubiquinone/menaquinone biosynthesis C-methylase UbiE
MHLFPHHENDLTLRESIERADSWRDLVALLFDVETFDIQCRNTQLRCDFYNDPTVCHLYDVLHLEERAAYLEGIIRQLREKILLLPENATVVEVGCGPGHILLGLATDAEVASKEITFVGFDSSAEMIEIAKEKQQSFLRLERVSFFTATSADVRAANALSRSSFLICRNILSWVSEPESEVQHWAKVLPRNAQLWIQELRRDLPFEIAKKRILSCLPFRFRGARLAFPPASMVSAYLRALTPKEMKTLLSDNGFAYTELQAQSGVQADDRRTAEVEMLFLATHAPETTSTRSIFEPPP